MEKTLKLFPVDKTNRTSREKRASNFLGFGIKIRIKNPVITIPCDDKLNQGLILDLGDADIENKFSVQVN